MISCCFGLIMSSIVDNPWLTIAFSATLFVILVAKEAYFHVKLQSISHIANNNPRDMKTTNMVTSIFGSFLLIDGLFVTLLVWPMHTTCSSYGMWLRLLKAVLIMGSTFKCYKKTVKAQTLEPVDDDTIEELTANSYDQIESR